MAVLGIWSGELIAAVGLISLVTCDPGSAYESNSCNFGSLLMSPGTNSSVVGKHADHRYR